MKKDQEMIIMTPNKVVKKKWKDLKIGEKIQYYADAFCEMIEW